MKRLHAPALDWLNRETGGPEWLASLPERVAECAEMWQLRLGAPFPESYISLPIPATLPDGVEVVLKMQFPHRESEHEAAALAVWHGQGAVRLIAHDMRRHAILMERCVPGTKLSALQEDAALDVFVELLPRLLKPAGTPFRPLADEAAWWAAELERRWRRAGRPFERALVDAALDALRTLPASQGENVLLHQDLHSGNVLRAEREPWLVIDPKPLLGEREFSVAPIVRAFELGYERRRVMHRLDRLTEALDLNRERARHWCLAQTVAWSFGSERLDQQLAPLPWSSWSSAMIGIARWLKEGSRP